MEDKLVIVWKKDQAPRVFVDGKEVDVTGVALSLVGGVHGALVEVPDVANGLSLLEQVGKLPLLVSQLCVASAVVTALESAKALAREESN